MLEMGMREMNPVEAVEIEKLSPRELDAAVAEHVMGWRRTGEGDHCRPLHTTETRKRPGQAEEIVQVNEWDSKGGHPRLESPDGGRFYFCGCNGTRQDVVDLPEFSTDIAAAWTVVDHLSAYPQSNVVCVSQPHDGNYASCAIFKLGAGGRPDEVLLRIAEVKEFAESRFGPIAGVAPVVIATAALVPRAICLAALKAVGQ